MARPRTGPRPRGCCTSALQPVPWTRPLRRTRRSARPRGRAGPHRWRVHDMGASPDRELTGLIRAARGGDDAAVSALFSAAYEELRQLAHLVRRSEARQTLNTTALVHEAWFKLLPSRGLSIE